MFPPITVQDNLTAAELIDKIRTATSLADLKHLVGPSDHENEAEKRRLAQMEDIWKLCFEKYDGQIYMLPYPLDETYERLRDEITEFENQYL